MARYAADFLTATFLGISQWFRITMRPLIAVYAHEIVAQMQDRKRR